MNDSKVGGMSGSVDVLAVLDFAIAKEEERRDDAEPGGVNHMGRSRTVSRLTDTRAAVAELIEEDKEFDAARQNFRCVFSALSGAAGGRRACAAAFERERVATERRAAALARVQGGAA